MTTETTGTPGPRTIKASEFKAKCLKLMDEVAESGEEIVITKNGRPVSRLVPFRERPRESLRHRQRSDRDSRRHHRADRRGVGSPVRPGPRIESVILLDTHVMLWLRLGDARLGTGARTEIDRAWLADEVCVSAVSFWEVALLKNRQRISFPDDVGLLAPGAIGARSHRDSHGRRDRNPRGHTP